MGNRDLPMMPPPGESNPRSRPNARPRARLLALALAALGAGCGAASTSGSDPASSGELPPGSLRVASDKVDGRLWLTPDAARATVAGAGALHIVGADIASEGDRVGAFVDVPDRECVLFLARTSPTIADVDLFAYEDDGSAFATDESPDAAATLLVCPPHPRRLYVVARVMSGTGFLSVGAQSVPADAADQVAQVTGARGRPGQDSGRLDAWPGLEAKIREHRVSVGSRWEDVRRVALPVGPRAASRVSVGIDAGRCADVLVVPSDEVASLEVVAEDTTGRIFARGREQGRDRTLTLCSAEATQVAIAVRPRASQGLVAVVIGRSQVGAEAEIAPSARIDHVTQTLDLPAARKWHDKALSARASYGPAKMVGTGAARTGSRSAVPLELPAGCARVDVVAGKPLADVLAELWDERGTLLGEGRGGAVASVFTCGAGGAARLDVEALGRPGPFAVEVRKDKAAPAALVAHPVAAGRLLARMNAGNGVAGADGAAAAQVVALDASTLKRLPLPVPANGCVEVIAALDAGGSGVDLRLVNTATDESTLTRARHVVAERLCASSLAIAGAAELRLGAGKADALVLVRPVPGS
ncbi:MAG TPA: hypothetical protein VE093_03805 [Polyangiaceae bacterium]|jgi:hypothetical protein|nr:hypothetical protein [Polyangiaceae bacterium]